MNQWANNFIAGAQSKGQSMPPPVWPFPTKSPGEYRRVDQGWDLQYPGTTPVPIRAMQSGTVRVGSDPTGFGSSFPLLQLDQPIGGNSEVYYGHTFADVSLDGRHVTRGQVIGHTGGAHSGGNASADSNFLEVGFWPPGPMGSGGSMKTYLLTGKATGKVPPTQSPPQSQLQCPGFFSSLFGGPAGLGEYFACHAISNVPGAAFLGKFASDPVDMLERAGLILLGSLFILIGIVVIAIGPAKTATKEVSSIASLGGLRGGGTRKPGITPEQRADRQRRLELAEQNASIGERRIAVKEAKERRLGGTF